MIDLGREGPVLILGIGVPENRFRPDGLAAWNEAQGEVDRSSDRPRASITASAGIAQTRGDAVDREVNRTLGPR